MWPAKFEDRLQQWYDLRQQCLTMEHGQLLLTINNWWFRAPWQPYYLHWDDQEVWPNPWQLLDYNHYCSLARCLGIVYTILLLDRSDFDNIQIIDSGEDNLVLVDNEKYILNWKPEEVLNISSQYITIKQSLDSSRLVHFLG